MNSVLAGLDALGSIAGLPKLPSLVPADTSEGFGGVMKDALQQVGQ